MRAVLAMRANSSVGVAEVCTLPSVLLFLLLHESERVVCLFSAEESQKVKPEQHASLRSDV